MAADPESYPKVVQTGPKGSSSQNLQEVLRELGETYKELSLSPAYVREHMVDAAKRYKSRNGSTLIVDKQTQRHDIAFLSRRLSGEAFERLAFKRFLEEGLPENTLLLPPEAADELIKAMYPERTLITGEFEKEHNGKYSPDFVAIQKGEDSLWRVAGFYEATMSMDSRHHVDLPHTVKQMVEKHPDLFVNTPELVMIVAPMSYLSGLAQQGGDIKGRLRIRYQTVDIDTYWAHEQAIGVIRQVYVEDAMQRHRRIAVQNRDRIDSYDTEYSAGILARRWRARGL